MATGYRLTAATGIHKGDRDYQQDQVALIQHTRHSGCLLAVVADGMGGRSGGRKASDQVMLSARQLFERYDPHGDDPRAMLQQITDDAHRIIKLTAISAEEEPHSTLAAFLVNPAGDSHWAHTGDSRIYHFRNGVLVHRTADHSYVQALVDRGELTEAQAAVHPQSNVLLGCLGMENDPPVSHHTVTKLVPGDVLMACTDGVWHYFKNEEMGRILAGSTPREASELLIGKARTRARGVGDNLSLVIVKLQPLG
jgi:serine/threonine protein phosphatase PrpC